MRWDIGAIAYDWFRVELLFSWDYQINIINEAIFRTPHFYNAMLINLNTVTRNRRQMRNKEYKIDGKRIISSAYL